MKRQPEDPTILSIWNRRRKLLDEVRACSAAIEALQTLFEHENQVDVSRHGSPDLECPDCGKGMIP